MAKIKKVDQENTPKYFDNYISPDFVFFCEGCKCDHGVWTSKRNNSDAIWQFNEDLDKPTISPSLHIKCEAKTICHSFVRDGFIQFLSDCQHSLAGQTIELPEIE